MKWFVVSDIHGFYTELVECLGKAGFEYDNPNHGLIVCGDIFDRGYEPFEVYRFLRRLPKNRRVLIKGNHETLLKDMCIRGYEYLADDSNGTSSTAIHLMWDSQEIYKDTSVNKYNNILINEILAWIDKEWVNYYEMDKFIFVHSFIPVYCNDKLPAWYKDHRKFAYNPKWRKIKDDEMWEDARWGCPWKMYQSGLFEEEEKNGKILVCGHWHTSDFFYNLDDILGYKNRPELSYKIYMSKGIIGLDGCTALTRQVNVLVINEDGTFYQGNK